MLKILGPLCQRFWFWYLTWKQVVGTDDLLYYCLPNNWYSFCRWLNSYPLYCFFHSRIWNSPFSGTTTQGPANYIHLSVHLALTETWLSSVDSASHAYLSSDGRWGLSSPSPFPNQCVLTFCKNLCSFKVQCIWLCHSNLSNEDLISMAPCLLSIPIPVTILGDSIFHVTKLLTLLSQLSRPMIIFYTFH